MGRPTGRATTNKIIPEGHADRWPPAAPRPSPAARPSQFFWLYMGVKMHFSTGFFFDAMEPLRCDHVAAGNLSQRQA